jgi:uncharacterized protein (DUF3084 family)
MSDIIPVQPGSDEPPQVQFHSAALPPAPKPRSKAVPVLAASILVFLAAAGVFGVLWANERGDHRSTIGKLDTARTEAGDSKAKLDAAEAKAKDADTKAESVKNELPKLRADGEKDKKCADAGRALADAAIHANESNARQVGMNAAIQLKATCS